MSDRAFDEGRELGRRESERDAEVEIARLKAENEEMRVRLSGATNFDRDEQNAVLQDTIDRMAKDLASISEWNAEHQDTLSRFCSAIGPYCEGTPERDPLSYEDHAEMLEAAIGKCREAVGWKGGGRLGLEAIEEAACRAAKLSRLREERDIAVEALRYIADDAPRDINAMPHVLAAQAALSRLAGEGGAS